MKPEDFLKITLTDIKVKLTSEFDKNFERKAFFNEKWKAEKLKNHRGSLMMRSGKTRRSIRSELTPMGIRFSSSLPHLQIHNEGGEITVTEKMKRFFWAMYYKSSNAVKFSIKYKAPAKTKRNARLTIEAKQWKSLALMKVGSKIKIPKRQILGHHPEVDKFIKSVINNNLTELEIKPFDK